MAKFISYGNPRLFDNMIQDMDCPSGIWSPRVSPRKARKLLRSAIWKLRASSAKLWRRWSICVPQSTTVSDASSLEPVYEQQTRMGTMPEVLLADTGYGSQPHADMSAEKGVKFYALVAGKAVKAASKEDSSKTEVSDSKEVRLNNIPQPLSTVWAMTHDHRDRPELFHGDKETYLFFDGHVEAIVPLFPNYDPNFN